MCGISREHKQLLSWIIPRQRQRKRGRRSGLPNSTLPAEDNNFSGHQREGRLGRGWNGFKIRMYPCHPWFHFICPDQLADSFQIIDSAHFPGLQWNIVKFQIAKRRANLFDPRLLSSHARMTILTRIMLLLYAIDDQISDGHALFAQERKIPFRLANTHRFRNRNERKPCLLLVMKHLPHGFDSLAEISKEEIDFVGNRTAA